MNKTYSLKNYLSKINLEDEQAIWFILLFSLTDTKQCLFNIAYIFVVIAFF